MKLHPFTLHECEDFFINRNVKLSRYNIVQAYMIMGGIPYYLDYYNPLYSLAQNIDAMFFADKPKLGDEFNRLFNSVFDHSGECLKIVRLLGKRHAGITREEIARQTGITLNGEYSKMMKALVSSDFVTRYIPFGQSKREEYYRLSDCFCWFWLHFKENKQIVETDYWQHHLKEPAIKSWRELAFIEICMQHIFQIKSALQIAGVSSIDSSYIVRGNDEVEGIQIDLIIDRADDVINICEMKFCKSYFEVTQSYAEKLACRTALLESRNPGKTFLMTLISATTLKQNEYSEIFSSNISIDELFR